MITATYFGEITELGSRAVWYSDEEDEDDQDDDIEIQTVIKPSNLPLKSTSHDSVRSKLSIKFESLQAVGPDANIVDCIISSISSTQYKNLIHNHQIKLLGIFGNFGQAYLSPIQEDDSRAVDYSLYLTFDTSNRYICGHEVGYFVELLRDKIYSELGLKPSTPVIILSKQFSRGEDLAYLSNCPAQDATVNLPFKAGCSLEPPALIKNPFESALFEQLTLTHKPAFVVCLPDPKNFWFDRTKHWPSLLEIIVRQILRDDNLEKTLIFT